MPYKSGKSSFYRCVHTVTVYHTDLVYDIILSCPANCGVPATPGNGSIETYQDTTEGAEIFFKCNPGFVPAGSMRAVCAGDGRWNPEPAGQRCTGELQLGCAVCRYRY